MTGIGDNTNSLQHSPTHTHCKHSWKKQAKFKYWGSPIHLLEWDAQLHRLGAHDGVTNMFLKNCHTIFEASSFVPLMFVGFSQEWVGADDFHETTLVEGFDPRAGHVRSSALTTPPLVESGSTDEGPAPVGSRRRSMDRVSL
eukprot:CAMPEP_0177185276 /NCGR_PEP_ID=MMETSP0367-20130122/18014_1 /TAXON_ID=447022 ORGANISM="Scrippsiella hangoei-like, Strain SHHI-4" /NCGR_SAMPLE_ID=MMETSP0367 /ASSEMBLY_ACC=CAM_ASM_000362 /LENGTH=141 /DNA_ID=CAMNT_0018632467 /DNA_START=53 /DNA_END=478 /DNA_ORIENTATION=+